MRMAPNELIESLSDAHYEITGLRADEDLRTSWIESLTALAKVTRGALLRDQVIILEYCLPKADIHGLPMKIDAVIIGRDMQGHVRMALIELKGAHAFTGESKRKGMVWTKKGDSAMEIPHPCRQVMQYDLALREQMKACKYPEPIFRTSAFVYLYNMTENMTATTRTALFGQMSYELRMYVMLHTAASPEALSKKLRFAGVLNI